MATYRTRWTWWILVPLVRVHPLVWGLTVGALVYLIYDPGVVVDPVAGDSYWTWFKTLINGPEVVTTVTAAGTTVAVKTSENYIINKIPAAPLVHVSKVVMADTPEEQGEEAFKAYKKITFIQYGPDGTAFGDLGDAIDDFSEISVKGIDLTKTYGQKKKKHGKP